MSAAATVSGSEDPEPCSRGAPAARLWSPAFVDLLIAEALFGFSYALFVLLPKLLAVGYGATAGQIGAVMAAFGVASLVTIPLIAPIVKRLDNRRAMVVGTSLLGVAAFGFMFIDSAGALAAVLRGAQGIAWSLTFAAGMFSSPTSRRPFSSARHRLYGAVALAASALGPAVRADRGALRRAPAVPDLQRGGVGGGPVLPAADQRHGLAARAARRIGEGGHGAQPRDRDGRVGDGQPGGRQSPRSWRRSR
jgi:hypothetical protein